MKRGPQLRKNQYVAYVYECIDSTDALRLQRYLNELHGWKPPPLGKPNNAPQELKDAHHALMAGQEVKMLVTVRRDGSRHHKVIR